MTLYGIKTCDTCRKALKAFAQADRPVTFIDLRVDGFDAADLDRWLEAVGWERLLNRRSTTWKGLADADRADMDQTRARALMLSHPTLIKRPVFDDGERVIVGFGKAEQTSLLGS